MASTRTDSVVAELTTRITTGAVSPGERMPSEATLERELGVSRTVVREAVARLRSAGLLESQQGRGTFVLAVPTEQPYVLATAPHTVAETVELIELRTAIEVEAASLAARRRQESDLERLRTASAELHPDDPPNRTIDADFVFHRAVALATRNRHFPALLGSLGPLMIVLPRDRRGADASGEGWDSRPAIAEHAAVLDAITAGDPVTAAAAMRLHLASSVRRLHASMG